MSESSIQRNLCVEEEHYQCVPPKQIFAEFADERECSTGPEVSDDVPDEYPQASGLALDYGEIGETEVKCSPDDSPLSVIDLNQPLSVDSDLSCRANSISLSSMMTNDSKVDMMLLGKVSPTEAQHACENEDLPNHDVKANDAPVEGTYSVKQHSDVPRKHIPSTLEELEEIPVHSENSSQVQAIHQELPLVVARSVAANTSKSPPSGSNVSVYEAPKSFSLNASSSCEQVELTIGRPTCETIAQVQAESDLPMTTNQQIKVNVFSRRPDLLDGFIKKQSRPTIPPEAQIKHHTGASERLKIMREKNKVAARKSRSNKKAKEERLRKEVDDLMCETTERNYTIKKLQQEYNQLKQLLGSHDCKIRR